MKLKSRSLCAARVGDRSTRVTERSCPILPFFFIQNVHFYVLLYFCHLLPALGSALSWSHWCEQRGLVGQLLCRSPEPVPLKGVTHTGTRRAGGMGPSSLLSSSPLGTSQHTSWERVTLFSPCPADPQLLEVSVQACGGCTRTLLTVEGAKAFCCQGTREHGDSSVGSSGKAMLPTPGQASC